MGLRKINKAGTQVVLIWMGAFSLSVLIWMIVLNELARFL